MKDLWSEMLSKEYLGEPEVEISDLLLTLGILLGSQPVLMKNIYLAYLKQEPTFVHKPMVGSALQFIFDYDRRIIEITRLDQTGTLTFQQFQRYIALIDLLFSKIYPVGSVVELDESLLSEDVRGMFSNSEIGLLVTIHGRRLINEEEKTYVDYVGTIWPFGILEDVEPLFFNNFLLKRVVSEGMSNEVEEKYAETVLRKQLLDQGAQSSFYTKEARVTEGGLVVGEN